MATSRYRMGLSRRHVPFDVRSPHSPPCRPGFPHSLFKPLDSFVFQKFAHKPRRPWTKTSATTFSTGKRNSKIKDGKDVVRSPV